MERIEHFCDRCGCKLEEHKRLLRFASKRYTTKIKVSTEDFKAYPCYSKIAEKVKENAKKDNDYMEFDIIGCRREKTLELCGNCRKDFEEFMKNV